MKGTIILILVIGCIWLIINHMGKAKAKVNSPDDMAGDRMKRRPW